MRVSAPVLIALPLLLLTASASATEYRGGSGTAVKGWSARNYDDTTSLATPKIVYFYDHDIYRNNFAEKMEGKEWFGNEDLQAAIKKFTHFKVRYDGLEARGWPKEWRERSKNGAAVLLLSSDNLMMLWFDRQTPADLMTPERVLAAVKAIEEYDKTHKPEKEKKEDKDKDKVAAKNDAAADNNLRNIKGLPPAPGEEKPKDDKKPAPPPKKASGPADE